MIRAAILAVAAVVGPVQDRESSVVVRPSGRDVSENLLRIELVFTAPQDPETLPGRVALLDSRGRRVLDAFLEAPLATDRGRRFTLYLHPGRVKAGLGANRRVGRALRAGELASVSVDGAVVRRWRVGPADLQGSLVSRWRARVPADPDAPLEVELGEAVDAQAATLIAVRTEDGRRVAGAASLTEGETVWRFEAQTPWSPGRYAVVVHTTLEDSAGNGLCRPFEAQAVDAPRLCESSEIPFAIVEF